MSDQNKLKTHRDKLTPKADVKPAKVKVDESQRLREISELVKANNRSTLSDEVIICQIYMESTFDRLAGKGVHDAKGLMQMQKRAVMQVYKYRKQKELGHMPSDKVTKQAFEEGQALHASDLIYDEATNIQLGTEYMQYWIDISESVEDAYQKYRGSDAPYYSKIKPCADKLKNDPENVQILHEIH